MRTIFRFFRGILRMAWSLFWGFFWTIAISFLVLVGIIYFTDSPSSGMDGFGRAAQKVVYQVGNLFGDQGLHRALGWHLAHRRRRQTIMSIAVLAGRKRRPRSTWIPISVKLL